MVFDEKSMLHEKSKIEYKAQSGAPNSLADTQEKEVELSENPKRPDGSEDNSSDSDGDERRLLKSQPRPLRLSCLQQGITGKMSMSPSH